MLHGARLYVTISVQNESLVFRSCNSRMMCAAMHPEADPGCKRRRLMHKQTVFEAELRGYVIRDAPNPGMSLDGDGSHAHLLANVVLPAVPEEAFVVRPDQDLRKKPTNAPPCPEFSRAVYNRVYLKVARWILTPAGARYAETWERCKLRREIGKGILPEQKKTPPSVHAF